MASSNNDNRTINSLDLFQCILALALMIAVVLGMAPKTSKEFIQKRARSISLFDIDDAMFSITIFISLVRLRF